MSQKLITSDIFYPHPFHRMLAIILWSISLQIVKSEVFAPNVLVQSLSPLKNWGSYHHQVMETAASIFTKHIEGLYQKY